MLVVAIHQTGTICLRVKLMDFLIFFFIVWKSYYSAVTSTLVVTRPLILYGTARTECPHVIPAACLASTSLVSLTRR
jgi:hypothetical protein